MSRDIHVTVAAIVKRDQRFLLVEETVAGRLVLNQPAGHLERHESLVQAVVRETLEETAWEFIPRALLGVYHYEGASGVTYVRFAIIGDVGAYQQDRALDAGIHQALWLTRTELMARVADHRGPQVRRAVEDYESGRRYPLDVLAPAP
ncbi:NUDIX hydrolase [Acidiferrobacter sp.]|uniref:NUDIX hydrolase n=1 Tax=Acidiferrobacter sp. TaxID=1872107 RepID=UPI002602B708|nr:NUDIX hydrolase [Acidiferrobacter sp.]